MEPRKDIMSQQAEEDKTLGEDIAVLSKKSKFLQKQVEDAQGQLKDIVRTVLCLPCDQPALLTVGERN